MVRGTRLLILLMVSWLVALVSLPASNEAASELERARQMLTSGKVEEAADVLREVVRKEPDNADAHLLLGSALALTSKPSEAVQILQRAVLLRPEFAPGYYTLGTVLARFSDLDSAGRMFEKAIALDPRFSEAHVSLALLLAGRKEYAAAREHLVRAIEISGASPAAAYPHYLMANVLLEQNETHEALKQIGAAVRLRPNYGEAYLSQGLIQKKLLDRQGALHSFQKAAELSPHNPEALYELGAARLQAGQVLEALAPLRKAVELKPTDRDALYQLCRALHGAGKADEARACQQKVVEIAKLEMPNLEAGRLNNEGVELEKAGDLEGALAKFRVAVNLNPFETHFRRNLALLLCRLRRWEEAIAELREVLEAAPDDTEASSALSFALEQAQKKQK